MALTLTNNTNDPQLLDKTLKTPCTLVTSLDLAAWGSLIDDEIAAALRTTFHFVGYATHVDPIATAQIGDLWYDSDPSGLTPAVLPGTDPTTTGMQRLEMYGTPTPVPTWRPYSYTRTDWDTWTMEDSSGWYWFGHVWNRLDADLSAGWMIKKYWGSGTTVHVTIDQAQSSALTDADFEMWKVADGNDVGFTCAVVGSTSNTEYTLTITDANVDFADVGVGKK
jgi:hypothetical protein